MVPSSRPGLLASSCWIHGTQTWKKIARVRPQAGQHGVDHVFAFVLQGDVRFYPRWAQHMIYIAMCKTLKQSVPGKPSNMPASKCQLVEQKHVEWICTFIIQWAVDKGHCFSIWWGQLVGRTHDNVKHHAVYQPHASHCVKGNFINQAPCVAPSMATGQGILLCRRWRSYSP